MKTFITMVTFILISSIIFVTTALFVDKSFGKTDNINKITVVDKINYLISFTDNLKNNIPKLSKDTHHAIFYDGPIKISALSIRKNTAVQTNFDWTWDIHILLVKYNTVSKSYTIEIILRQYQMCINSKYVGFTTTAINDLDANGIITEIETKYYRRSFELKEKESDILLSPIYPKGFIDLKWQNSNQYDIQKQYNTEVDYWNTILKKRESIQ
jgi:hypothetical protein